MVRLSLLWVINRPHLPGDRKYCCPREDNLIKDADSKSIRSECQIMYIAAEPVHALDVRPGGLSAIWSTGLADYIPEVD